MKLAFAFEYLLKGHGRKDVVQVPMTLAALLGGDWCFISRPSEHAGEVAGRGSLVFVGGSYSTENRRRLSEDNVSALIYTRAFAIRSGWKAASLSDFYATMFLCGRTGLSAAFYHLGRRVRGRRGFVYVKADLNLSGRRHLDARGRGRWLSRLKLQLLTKFVDLISVETDDTLRWLESTWPEIASRTIVVRSCPLPVDTGTSGAATRGKRLIAVSRLGAPEKATDILLAAMRQFSARFPEWKLTLVGPDSPRLQELLEEYRDLVCLGKVEYVGYIADSVALVSLLRSSQFFVQPSRWEGDCGSFSLIEAIREGCIPICTRVFPVEEILGKYSIELTLEPNDVEALSEALMKLASNSERWSEIREYLQGRTGDWNWEAQLKPVVMAYKKCMHIAAERAHSNSTDGTSDD